jgi:hypothetical protein
MEQKTCTIRVINKQTEKQGVLFFKGGELLDARIRDMHGKEAAYEIFSWGSPSLAIQDTCVLNKRVIKEDLQAVLFDAMRLKDEAGLDESAFREPPAPETKKADKNSSAPGAAPSSEPAKPPVQTTRRKGIASIDEDDDWNLLMALADSLGRSVNAGNFKACYVDRGKENGLVLLPGNRTTVVTLERNCPGDVIRRLLYE